MKNLIKEFLSKFKRDWKDLYLDKVSSIIDIEKNSFVIYIWGPGHREDIKGVLEDVPETTDLDYSGISWEVQEDDEYGSAKIKVTQCTNKV